MKNKSVAKDYIKTDVVVPRIWFEYTESILREKGIQLDEVDDEIISEWVSYLVGYSDDESRAYDLIDRVGGGTNPTHAERKEKTIRD